MDFIRTFLDFFLNLDKYLNQDLIASYGGWLYLILFVIIFCETGLVVTPFLPGDSLLFAAGALAAQDTSGTLNIFVLFLILTLAAVAGDSVNYMIGHFIGMRIFDKNIPFLKHEHLDRTHEFYEKYGGKTIILARFVPIVRTFAPFVAGVGRMHYGQFVSYNVIGGVAWIAILTFAGYFFGQITFVKNNFEMVVIAIIIISILPMVFEYVRNRRRVRAARTEA